MPRIASFDGLVFKIFFNDHPPRAQHGLHPTGRYDRSLVAWRMTIQLQELKDGEYDFTLEDVQVSHLALGAQFDIYVRDAKHAGLKITITTPFRIGESEGPLSEPIDPEKDDPRIGKLILSLRRKMLVLCHVDPDGTLKLRFDDGLVIVVEPDSEYEAWELDHAKLKIVGAAGGELAIWNR